MSIHLILHSIALVVVNFITHWAGSDWSVWTHDRHPSAVAIPIGSIVAVSGFLFWYHTGNALSAGKWKLNDTWSWFKLYVMTLIIGAVLFFAAPDFLSGQWFSAGRLLAFSTFQAMANALVFAVAIPQRSYDSAGLVRRLLRRRWFKVSLLTAAFVIVFLLIFGFIEAVFLVLNLTRPAGPQKVYEGEYLSTKFSDYDRNLGKKLQPDADVQCRLKVDANTVWDVRYTTDEFGRRRTTHAEGSKPSKFAVFFGCSFLFGEGTNDNETIPSLFAGAAPEFHAYNYGVPGYGTQQMLAKLESGTILNEVIEQSGIVIYVYLEDVHEPRVIGDMQLTNSFAAYFPYYDFNANGELQRFENFKTGRPVLSSVYGLLGHSQFIKYMGMNFPKPNERDFRIVVGIIEKSRQLCQQQLGCEKFYVVFYPRHSPHRRLIPYLERLHISVLDYSTLFDPATDGLSFKGDGHPTPLANRQLSRQLASDISE